MSYESSGGGSHSTHQWVAIGHEWRDVHVYVGQIHTSASGSTSVPMEFPEWRPYVIRACQLCPEVWWQEYDPAKAVAA